MLIKEWMSRSVITLESDKSLNEGLKLFETRVISMLPVLKEGRLVGIVTDGDIKKASPSDATTLDKFEMTSLMDTVRIESVMSAPVKGISGMPVLDNAGKLIGIITKSDVFRCFVSFTGVSNKGQVFAFRIQDKPGIIKYLTDMIRNSGGRLGSILTSYDDVEEGFRKVFFHTFDIDADKYERLVEKFYGTGNLLYSADQSSNSRRIF